MNFAKRRFNALFACQAVGGLVSLFVYASIVDSIIVGNLVGVDVLARNNLLDNADVLPTAAEAVAWVNELIRRIEVGV